MTYTFSAIDDPLGIFGTNGFGINDAGQIVGSYGQALGPNGFVYIGGTYSTLDDPLGAKGTHVNGISDTGNFVGTYEDSSGTSHGFYLSSGTYTTVDDPLGTKGTVATGINNLGEIVGYYVDSTGKDNGFVAALGYGTLDDPAGTKGTVASGINDASQVVGSFEDSTGKENGFVFSNGTYTTLNDPLGTEGTVVTGINDAGQIVGYYTDSSGTEHGFLYSGGTSGTYTTIDDALGTNTMVTGINNAGQISGSYTTSSGAEQTFLATPPAPTAYTVTLLNISNISSVTGINDGGEIVGYLDTNAGFPQQSFISNGSTATMLNDPLGTNGTFAYGINDVGQVVGYYTDSNALEHGFLYSGGSYSTLDDPSGAGGTQPTGINSKGQVAGSYKDFFGNEHGFLYSGGTYTTLNAPGAISTQAMGINDQGQVVGIYIDSSGYHGFLYSGGSNGTYTTLNDPLAAPITNGSAQLVETGVFGINDAGQIVGVYVDSNSGEHAFLYSGGTYTTLNINAPFFGVSLEITPTGINNAGQMVAGYFETNASELGFLLATPASSTAPTPPATVQQEIDGLYVGLYGVAATGPGVQFWINATSAFDPSVTAANAATTAISTADAAFLGQQFVQTQSTYFNSLYGGDTDTQFISALYQNLSNSSGSQAGVGYWVGLLTAAETANGGNVLAARAGVAGQFVHDLMSDNLTVGATALGLTAAQYQALVTGQQAMLDKAEISQYWATELAAPGGSILNYTTESGPAFAAAQNVLPQITSDPGTVNVTITGINNAVAQQNLSLV